MARLEMPRDRLSDYERAICYHTLPRVVHPVTVGLIVAYLVCLAEAAALLAYGFMTSSIYYARLGSYAVFGIVAFGVVIFVARALVNEVRMRGMLAAAKGVPDAPGAGDIPDPFAEFLLLGHPSWSAGDLFPCTDKEGNVVYYVETGSQNPRYRVRDAHDNELFTIHVLSRASSFLLGGVDPARLSVRKGETEIARITRRFSLSDPIYAVEGLEPAMRYRVAQGNVYHDRERVGRLYTLRQSTYLDVRRDHFHEGLVALFITMQ